MAISYIKGTDGATSVSAAEKIKLFYLKDLKQNPWLVHRAMPVQAEALKTGGGKYLFRSILGIDLPERRTSAPSASTVEYKGVIKNTEVELLVSQPFQTLAFPMENGDLVQLDGINYSPIAGSEITKSLVAAEIDEETKKITTDANILSLDGGSDVKSLDKLKLIKQKIANYYAINEDNADWKGATSATKAYDYFTAQNGTLNPEDIRIHMHPATFMELSNAVTEAGAGSDMQYKEFVSGQVPMVGGVEVIINKYIGVNDVYILPLNVTGTPDPEVMTTRIATKNDELNFVEVMRGQHYFDAVLVTPELISKITFTVSTKSASASKSE